MDHQAQFWEKKLKKLESIPTAKNILDEAEMRDWVAECVATFSYLGVNSEIIRGFMDMFKYLGPGIYTASQQWLALYDAWKGPAAKERRIREFFYPNIAFTSAYALLERVSEQERLVPRTLVDLLRNKTEFSHFATSLESMESAYQGKEVENLLAATGALLFPIINIHPDPQLHRLERQPKKQLEFLTKNKKILDDFGVSTELIELFQNFRYLRNVLSQHKKANLPSIPLAVGYGFASLVLIFLYGVMARGVLIKT